VPKTCLKTRTYVDTLWKTVVNRLLNKYMVPDNQTVASFGCDLRHIRIKYVTMTFERFGTVPTHSRSTAWHTDDGTAPVSLECADPVIHFMLICLPRFVWSAGGLAMGCACFWTALQKCEIESFRFGKGKLSGCSIKGQPPITRT
jgi:hypothetical protein